MNRTVLILHKIVVPALYAIIWIIGLAVGLYDLLPQVSGGIGAALVVACSVYVIFLLESQVFIMDLGMTEENWDFVLQPNALMASQLALFLAVVFFSGLLYVMNDTASVWVIVICMGLHKFAMAYLGNNTEKYLNKGLVNNLKS